MTSPGEAVRRLEHIAIIGAGLAGRSFSRHLLAHGYRVTLEDVLPSNLRAITSELEGSDLAPQLSSLFLASTVEDAVRSADLAIDFVPDELESKLEILSMIDRMAPPRTLLLTPTDVLSISDLASCTYRADRCFGLSGLSRHTAFSPSTTLSLLHPSAADPSALLSLQAFLTTIGLPFRTLLDPHPALLAGRGISERSNEIFGCHSAPELAEGEEPPHFVLSHGAQRRALKLSASYPVMPIAMLGPAADRSP